MKSVCFIFSFLICLEVHAALPMTQYYGKYEIESCKKIDVVNEVVDMCAFKKVDLNAAPAAHGAPHSRFLFSGKNLKDKWETMTPIEGINHAGLKKEDSGFDHYWIRITDDQRSEYFFDDFYLKKGPAETEGIILILKKRVASKENENGTLSLGHYEFRLTPSK